MLALIALCGAQSGCFQARYLAQQASGQFHLLRERRRIDSVLSDPAVDAETRRRLSLAREARQFGVEVLGLHGGASYTRYLDTHGEPVAWNVSSAEKDRLKAYLVKFPIAGAVPYLGYFREADARKEQARTEALGYDTEVRSVAGYSTLGWTADPIYSSMLEGGDARIVEVTLHEMLHGTVYLPGRPEWNESLATFVGVRGAALFFELRGGAGQAARVLGRARQVERRTEAFRQFLEPILKELEQLYSSPISKEEKLRLREPIFERARANYLEQFPSKPGEPPGRFARGPINNAVLVGYLVYHRSAPEHRRAYELLGADLPAMIRLYKHALDDPHPLQYLQAFREGLN